MRIDLTEIKRRISDHYNRRYRWRKRFALFPTYVDSGYAIVWLEHYWIKRVSGCSDFSWKKVSDKNFTNALKKEGIS